MKQIRLLKDTIADPVVQENMRRVEDYIRESPLLRGQFEFRSFSLAAPSYPATVTVQHKLGFTPTDIVLTSEIGATPVQFNFSAFTATDLSITITGAVAVRLFVGRYDEGRLL